LNETETKRAILLELRDKHVAYAFAKLRDPASKALLRANVEGAVAALLSAKVADVVDREALVRAIEAALDEAMLREVVRPVVKTASMLEVARLREDPSVLGTYVPDAARADVRALLERPGVVPEKLVRQVLGHEAMEGVMREVLEGALRDFQEKVNPFTSEWGLPALLKRFSPMGIGLGLGGIAKSFESVQKEFEKRLEPELSRFLGGAAKRALAMTADFVVERSDKPAFVALRKELFAWLLEQPMSEIVASADDETMRLGESISFEVTRHVTSMEASKKRRRATIEMALSAHKSQSLAEALSTYGVTLHLDVDALTEVLWKPIQVVLDGPAAHRLVEEIVGAFYDDEIAKL
jgi:hypothetical protein